MTLEECCVMYKLWSICHLHRLRVKNVMPLSPWKSSTGLSRNRIYWEKIHILFQTQDEIQSLSGILGLYYKAQPLTALQRRPQAKYQQHRIRSLHKQKEKLQKALIDRIST